MSGLVSSGGPDQDLVHRASGSSAADWLMELEASGAGWTEFWSEVMIRSLSSSLEDGHVGSVQDPLEGEEDK